MSQGTNTRNTSERTGDPIAGPPGRHAPGRHTPVHPRLVHRREVLGWLAGGLLLGLSRQALAQDEGWQVVLQENGVTVRTRGEAGRSLPVFRGTGLVDARLFDILAVLHDTGRQPEWMANCGEAKVIKQLNEFDRIIYNRTDAPWPVSDRDVVLHATVEASVQKREVWARFRAVSHPGSGPIDGVVRMPRLQGFWHLEAVSEDRTRVTYQVDADPGGMIPDWAVVRASRKLPLETITGLRRQVKKTAGKYQEFVQKYDPARGGAIPTQFQR